MKRVIKASIENIDIAENPNTPPEVLAELARDEDEDVRCYVAENLNTPSKVLAELARDWDERVREAATNNLQLRSRGELI